MPTEGRKERRKKEEKKEEGRRIYRFEYETELNHREIRAVEKNSLSLLLSSRCYRDRWKNFIDFVFSIKIFYRSHDDYFDIRSLIALNWPFDNCFVVRLLLTTNYALSRACPTRERISRKGSKRPIRNERNSFFGRKDGKEKGKKGVREKERRYSGYNRNENWRN